MSRNETKAEIAGKVVNRFADGIHDVAGTLRDVEVPDTVHLKDIKDWDLSKGMRWLGENGMTLSKYSGAALMYVTEYLTRVMNSLLINNPVLRGMENKFANSKIEKPQQDSKLSKFKVAVQKMAKKHPALTSYLAYYMFMGGILLGGGYAANGANQDQSDSVRKEAAKDVDKHEVPIREEVSDKAVVKEKLQDKKTPLSYEELGQKAKTVTDDAVTQTVDPKTEQYVKQALDAYWPEIAVGLTELETYRAVPKVHAGEKRATNGLGCTWNYVYNKNGRLVQKPNVAKKTPTRTKDENYEQCKRHLMFETLPVLQQVTKGKKNISARQAVALVYVGYQRTADMAEIAKKISSAKTVQQVADAYAHYEGPKKYREGTLKRRWICAAYAANVIDANDLLNMDCDAFAALNINTVYRNGHFLLGNETAQYVLSRVRGKKETVKDFLSDFSEGKKILASVQGGEKIRTKVVVKSSEQDKKIEQSMKSLNAADKAYKKKNYKKAADLYEQAIAQDADNMEAYSSLALAYLRLGDENKSIEYYQKSIQAVVNGNKRMNANKDLLLDREVKASSYYNAGMAYEKMAALYAQKGDTVKMSECYRSALNNYQIALENAKMKDMSEARQQVYQKAIDRLHQQQKVPFKQVNKSKGTKLAFNAGMSNIKSKEILDYGQYYKENSRG